MPTTIARGEPASAPALDAESEAYLARLARTAYDVALAHGVPGAFTDLELGIWRELRKVVGGRTAEA